MDQINILPNDRELKLRDFSNPMLRTRRREIKRYIF